MPARGLPAIRQRTRVILGKSAFFRRAAQAGPGPKLVHLCDTGAIPHDFGSLWASGGLVGFFSKKSQNTGTSAGFEGLDKLPPTKTMDARVICEPAVEAQADAGGRQLIGPLLTAIESEDDFTIAYRSRAMDLREQEAFASIGWQGFPGCGSGSSASQQHHRCEQKTAADLFMEVLRHESFIPISFWLILALKCSVLSRRFDYEMAENGTVLRGPWRKSSVDPALQRPTLAEGDAPVRVLLGFLTKECALALGHSPDAGELADWANHQRDQRGLYCLFGRKISRADATVILKHPKREVTVRRARFRQRHPGILGSV